MQKNKGSNFPLLLLFVIPLYATQGILLPSGPIPQSLLLMWFFMDSFYLMKFLTSKDRDGIGIIVFLFWLLNTVSWVISPKLLVCDGEIIRTFNHYKNLTIGLLTYYPFRYWIKNRIIDERYLKFFSILIFSVAILLFFHYNTIKLSQTVKDAITNNEAYLFVCIFPILYVFREKKVLWYSLVIGCLFFILLGAKRGAIICFASQLIIFVLFNMKDTGRRTSHIKSLFITSVIVGVLGFVGYNLLQGNEYLLMRLSDMEEGNDASGDARIFQYTAILNAFVEAPLFTKLFGHGFNQTLNIAGNYAHNDWLELLTNQGIVGVLMYLLLFIQLLKSTKAFNGNNWRKCMFYMVLAPWFIRSLISMGYVSMETFYFMIAIVYSKYGSQRLSVVERKKYSLVHYG